MKITNCVHFLLAILLLVSGSIPVLAQTPDQCGSVEPIRPGDRVTDAVSDVPAAHVDITEVETSLSGERLTVVFNLRDLPETLRFNRTEFMQGTMEYAWEVAIDVDNDRSTGPGGFDMLLSAYHITDRSRKGTGADLLAPIGAMVEAALWEIDSDGSINTVTHTIAQHAGGSTTTHRDGGPAVHVEADTITIAVVIPGITSESRLAFEAYDVQFAGGTDQIACHDSYRKSVGSWGCGSGAVLIRPGQTATDEVSEVSTAYLDIVEVSTSLSGETLTVAFRFKDIPETLTFNRKSTSTNSMEYSWGVLVDADADPETGDGGFDYLLSAHHIVWPGHAGDNTEAPIEEVAKADVWEMKPGGIIEGLRDASLEVSAETDMMTLSGRIPGITPDSRLSFLTHEHRSESDEAGCREPPVILKSSSQCDIDGTVTPGEGVIDDASDTLAAHVDVTEISTSLSGETLTVVFQFRDVPETLTFDRTGVPEDAVEYSWEVSIDVDSDQETGFEGFEYILSAIHVASPGASGRNRSAAITTDDVQVNSWALKSTGKAFPDLVYLNNARIEVSAGENTITLSGKIPGITADSRLAFGVNDDLEGAEEVGCLTRFGLGQSIFQSSSEEHAAVQGHSVGDDVPHELVGHIDIRDVTTALEGETLSVTFQLRNLPETLTFARTGVPEDALEYSWEVSIDVDNDPATGSGGFDYMLSAGYFVPRLAQGSNTVAEITQPGFVKAGLWGLDRKGYRVLAEADVEVEVSVDDNTITLTGEIPGITSESRLKFRAYDFFGGSVEMSSHAPSITGQAADIAPESLAPISVSERVMIPPRYAQHLNSLKYLDGVPAILINHQGEPVTALDVDQMKSDRWLQLWAMSAMEDDGSLEFAHSIAKTQSVALPAHNIAVIYMNAFAAAEQHCAENREELEALIQTYANQASALPNIQFPYLTVVHELATRLTQMDETQNVGSCHDYLASLSDFPKVRTFCFGGDANEQVMGQKAMAKQLAVQREELTDPTAPHSLLVSAANLNCWPETHE
ncbi:MAG: hypothetical protein OXF50_16445 [Caldilineaceae bacterium]|nr:hypothetical protein [Caldilineaceae bacterium]